jgi:uncharacterized protein (DUF433 family)
MNTLETDIEISADGSVRLLSPLPAWLRPGRSHVLLVMEDHAASSRGIERTENVCGGDACIASTRIPVWTLEQSRRLGFTEAELLTAYPSLKKSDLLAAWAYVAEHPLEIENAILDNDEA